MNATNMIERITTGPRRGWFRVVGNLDNGFSVIGEAETEKEARFLSTFPAASERIAFRLGRNERADWIKVSATFPSLKDWDESEDYPDWATDKIMDSISAESVEEDHVFMGDLISAFKAGFFGV